MPRLTRPVALLLCLSLAFGGCASVRPIDTHSGAGADLGEADIGKRVAVMLNSGRIHRGSLVAVEVDAILIHSEEDDIVIEFSEIERLEIQEGGSAWRSVASGVVLSAVVAVGLLFWWASSVDLGGT